MVPTPSSTQPPAGPAASPPAVLAAWPRSAQRVTMFLLGVTTTLLAVHLWEYLPWGSRPSVLNRAGEQAYQVDLNRADRAELLQLPGVGDSLAGRIEEHRRQRGGFQRADQLMEVKGVGPSTLARLRDWVTVEGESRTQRSSTAPTVKPRHPAKKTSKKGAALAEPIDINRATPAELQRLPGVGPKTAQRIVEERMKGPFRSVDDLRRVPRMGPKTLENLRPYITVGNHKHDTLEASAKR